MQAHENCGNALWNGACYYAWASSRIYGSSRETPCLKTPASIPATKPPQARPEPGRIFVRHANGSGKKDDQKCEVCNGSGKVIQGIGGA
jgi:hypothetical protein